MKGAEENETKYKAREDWMNEWMNDWLNSEIENY